MQQSNPNQSPPRLLSVAEMVEETFGQSVRERRLELGWSQRELAERVSKFGLSLDPTAVTRIEKGQRAVRLGEASMIARELKLPLSVMITGRTITDLKETLSKLQTDAVRAQRYIEEVHVEMNKVHRRIQQLEKKDAAESEREAEERQRLDKIRDEL